jgi:hypothetical protein
MTTPKTEIIAILQDMADEFNIVRAGNLAKIRIANQAAKILQDYPFFINNQCKILDTLLDFISNEQAMSVTLSSKIEKLKSDTGQLKMNENFDEILIIQNIFQIIGMT